VTRSIMLKCYIFIFFTIINFCDHDLHDCTRESNQPSNQQINRLSSRRSSRHNNQRTNQLSNLLNSRLINRLNSRRSNLLNNRLINQLNSRHSNLLNNPVNNPRSSQHSSRVSNQHNSQANNRHNNRVNSRRNNLLSSRVSNPLNSPVSSLLSNQLNSRYSPASNHRSSRHSNPASSRRSNPRNNQASNHPNSRPNNLRSNPPSNLPSSRQRLPPRTVRLLRSLWIIIPITTVSTTSRLLSSTVGRGGYVDSRTLRPVSWLSTMPEQASTGTKMIGGTSWRDRAPSLRARKQSTIACLMVLQTTGVRTRGIDSPSHLTGWRWMFRRRDYCRWR